MGVRVTHLLCLVVTATLTALAVLAIGHSAAALVCRKLAAFPMLGCGLAGLAGLTGRNDALA